MYNYLHHMRPIFIHMKYKTTATPYHQAGLYFIAYMSTFISYFYHRSPDSITTWTRWGGSGSKNVCFCPRSGYKNSPQAICFVNSVCTILSLRKKGTPHNISKLARADISCQFKKTRYFRIVIITSWQKTIPYFVFDICIPSTRKPRICNKSKYWQ